MLNQSALIDYADTARTLMAETVTPLALTRIDGVLAQVSSSKNSRDNLNLANELAQVLKEEVERDPPETGDDDDAQASDDSQGQTDDTDDGNDDEGDENPSTSNPDLDDSAQSEDNDDSNTSQESLDSNVDNQTQQQASSDLSGEQAPALDSDEKKAMKDMLESDDDSGVEDLSDALASLLEDEINEASSSRGNHPVASGETLISTVFTPDDPQQALDTAQAATSALRSRIARLVQAHTKTKRKTSKYGRRLDDRKLHRVLLSNPAVFKSVSKKKAVNTAVQIIVDVSGSMELKMALSMNSTLSITAALKAIPHLSVSTALFPGYHESAVTVMTGHEQSIYDSAGYYPVARAHGCTPLLPALVWSGESLQSRKETRKILLVITDGAPDQRLECQDMIQRLNAGNVEVYGLGLGVAQQTMSSLFGELRAQVIDDEEMLAQATFSLLENTLYQAA